jgi:septal ring factor EnvC (AmiA/AmiB activator)
MIMKHLLRFSTALTALTLTLIITGTIFAQEDLDQVRREIEELQDKLEQVQSEKQSLSQTVSFLNTKISLAQAEISQTEAEIGNLQKQIDSLQGKIGILNTNLEKISEVLVNRIAESYKNTNHNQPVMLLLLSNRFSDFFRSYKYLKVSQQHDREVIFALEEARTNYDTQKTIKEVKQDEVEALQDKLLEQKAQLDGQKDAKQAALRVTQNDERRYQAQLATAMAELEAIQSIIAGKGDETKVGAVAEGARIATVIPGPSTCSNGGHLHLEMTQNGAHRNPAAYLSSKDVTWDNSPDGPFAFTGSWRWPIADPVRITQGYGMTFYAATLRYYGGAPHTGLDMVNNTNFTVSSMKDGTLFRGAIGCKGGTLRYVRVEHADGISSYYLHVNY